MSEYKDGRGDYYLAEGLRDRKRNRVYCDEDCGAYEDPEAPDEYKEAFFHWRDHGYLSGCSHGN